MTSGCAACIRTARAPPNSTVTSRCTFQETESGPKYPGSLTRRTVPTAAANDRVRTDATPRSGGGHAGEGPDLTRDVLGREDDQVVPRPRGADVEVPLQLLVALVDLREDHHRPLEPAERVHARRQH